MSPLAARFIHFETIDAALQQLAERSASDGVGGPLLGPGEAFRCAISCEPNLLIADGALDHADRLAPERFAFARIAALALAEYSHCGAKVGEGLGIFFARRRLTFANVGKVKIRYVVNGAGGELEDRWETEFHLKEEDANDRVSEVARIYFHSVRVGDETKVAVFYCGPHPEYGILNVIVRMPNS